MRLIAWNANYNNRPRSLEETVALLEPLKPDLLVLSEIAPPSKSNPLSAHWVGGAAPGLAVITLDNFDITPHPANEGAPPLVGGFSVRGRIDFDLLAAWPVKTRDMSTYHQILMSTLDRFSDFLSSGTTILAGDLNSSTRVSGQGVSHPQFVNRAQSMGLVSAYHTLTGESHGEETTATYLHGPKESDRFHIDYCLIPEQLIPNARLEILEGGYWEKLSDHFPLVLDITDDALASLP